MDPVNGWLRSRGVYADPAWLQTTITELKLTQSPLSLPQRVFSRWLSTDLSSGAGAAALPVGMKGRQGEFQVGAGTGGIVLQIDMVTCIANSAFSQIDRIQQDRAKAARQGVHDARGLIMREREDADENDDDDDNDNADAEQQRQNNHANPNGGAADARGGRAPRCLLMRLTDGVQTVRGMEYRPLRAISKAIAPGSKIRVRGARVRNNTLLLDGQCVELLEGSGVDALRDANSYATILRSRIGYDDDDDEGDDVPVALPVINAPAPPPVPRPLPASPSRRVPDVVANTISVDDDAFEAENGDDFIDDAVLAMMDLSEEALLGTGDPSDVEMVQVKSEPTVQHSADPVVVSNSIFSVPVPRVVDLTDSGGAPQEEQRRKRSVVATVDEVTSSLSTAGGVYAADVILRTSSGPFAARLGDAVFSQLIGLGASEFVALRKRRKTDANAKARFQALMERTEEALETLNGTMTLVYGDGVPVVVSVNEIP